MADNTSPESPTARGLDRRALDYTASIAFDRRLYAHDIAASIAHARMLAKQGIVPGDDAEAIVRGLEEIRGDGCILPAPATTRSPRICACT